MYQSRILTKTRKEVPADEQAKNAILLTRAGYINKNMAGVYEFLPLGLRSIEKIKKVIREEMDAIGGQELLLSSLQSQEIWKKTGRWDSGGDVWFKTKLRAGADVGLGWTHEEPIIQMMTHHISSYRDLPKYAYQFQTKFRNEERAKSGILRTREFEMKDMYSFSKDEKEHKRFYESCVESYLKIFNRLGLGDCVHRTYASGGAFTSSFSDEFQAVLEAGEDTIYISKKTGIALNKEIYNKETLSKLKLEESDLEEKKASEVGNIFSLGTKFANDIGLVYKDEKGKEEPVYMGSYGIGPARLLGVIVEKFAKDNEMVLPKSVAPYTVHLLSLGNDSFAKTVYKKLQAKGIEVLFDDRDIRTGEKLADSDLMGIPYRAVVSKKNKRKIEFKNRLTGETKILSIKGVCTNI